MELVRGQGIINGGFGFKISLFKIVVMLILSKSLDLLRHGRHLKANLAVILLETRVAGASRCAMIFVQSQVSSSKTLLAELCSKILDLLGQTSDMALTFVSDRTDNEVLQVLKLMRGKGRLTERTHVYL